MTDLLLQDLDLSFSPAIASILNHAIRETTSIYDDQPRSPAMIASWLQTKIDGGYPILGLVSPSEKLLAFGTYAPYRPFSGYRHTVEHSLYVDPSEVKKGYGSRILQALEDHAKAKQYHVLLAGIDSDNLASIQLHKKHGFLLCGRFREVGFKFGRWLDVEFYQKFLYTPPLPLA